VPAGRAGSRYEKGPPKTTGDRLRDVQPETVLRAVADRLSAELRSRQCFQRSRHLVHAPLGQSAPYAFTTSAAHSRRRRTQRRMGQQQLPIFNDFVRDFGTNARQFVNSLEISWTSSSSRNLKISLAFLRRWRHRRCRFGRAGSDSIARVGAAARQNCSTSFRSVRRLSCPTSCGSAPVVFMIRQSRSALSRRALF